MAPGADLGGTLVSSSVLIKLDVKKGKISSCSCLGQHDKRSWDINYVNSIFDLFNC